MTDHLPAVRRLRHENGWGSRKISAELGISKDQAIRMLNKLKLEDAQAISQSFAAVQPLARVRAPAFLKTADDYAQAITESWQQSVEAIFETGRLLNAAKDALTHGEFTPMVNESLPFGPSTAQRLMKIAADKRLQNRNTVQHLPPSWGTLYELTKLDDTAFEHRITDGTIRPDMERRDIATAVKATRRSARESHLGERQAAAMKEQSVASAVVEQQDWPRHGPEEALLVGRAAEHLVCADALMRGYNAFLAGQGTPYDVVLEKDGKMLRLQVKASQWERNVNSTGKNERMAYSFRVMKSQPGRLDRQQCDLVACVALDIGAIAYLLVEECTQTVQLMSKPIEPNGYARTYEKTVFDYSLIDAVSRVERIGDVKTLFPRFPSGPYGVIYADPPWKFNVWSEQGLDRAAENHYPVMDVDSIRSLGPFLPAAGDCVLFLWATAPMLVAALQVMASWGFDYKSSCVWHKNVAGTGYWNRSRHELLLVGTRGNVPAPAQGTQWSSVLEAPIGKHSEKPNCFHAMIEEYFPHLPKIELFARRARPNWDSWGLDAPQAEAAE